LAPRVVVALRLIQHLAMPGLGGNASFDSRHVGLPHAYGSWMRRPGTSLSSTCIGRASWRFRFADFLVRMWRTWEWPDLNPPLPFARKRFAAPRFVFSFGMTLSFMLARSSVPRAGQAVPRRRRERRSARGHLSQVVDGVSACAERSPS